MTLVLADTSAWIEFFRQTDSPYAAIIDGLLEENRICTCHLVMAELLPTVRSQKQFEEIRAYFQALPLLADPEDLWSQVIDAAYFLRRRGVNGVGIPDLIVATVARSHRVPVLSKDRHFAAMRDHLGLEILDVTRS